MTLTTVFASTRQRLEAERAALIAEITALEARAPNREENAGIGNIVAETSDQVVTHERDLALLVNARDLLARVDAALHRIAEGTYGVCAGCGGMIAAERLEALPYATLCITCQAARERRR